MRRSRISKTVLGLFVAAAVGLGVALYVTPSPVTDARSWPVSPALLDAEGSLFHVRLSSREEYCLPVPLERMGPWLPLVAVQVEDKRFFSHPGVDVLALGRAIFQNLAAGRVVSGASTISSQVVRLTYPRERSMGTKVSEFLQALKLDWELDKEEILELYLNRAPFGGPVRGVEAAARSYFGKRAEELSLAEAALLIGMLRGPSVYRPDRHPERTLERRNAILHRLAESGAIDASRLELALLEPIPPGRSAIPGQHRHFADLVLRDLPLGYWEKGGAPVATTLDPGVQRLLEMALDGALNPMPERVTGAGAVLDNATGALLAYVGNRRFYLDGGTNWVDCAASQRSPGSALKPFIYLQAMESGKLIPASLLADTPLSFAGLAPRNYDRRYRGMVDAGYALANSLNAPAVRVLRMAGGESSLQFLRLAGFTHLRRSAAYYGDALVLGGCEVTLWQLLEGYATLATLGVYRPVTPLAEKAEARRQGAGPGSGSQERPLGEKRLFSAAGSYLIAESLRDTGRMSPILSMALQEKKRHIAFKTGTSFGMRDAWAAAYTPQYTTVVWLGDPAGFPHPMLSGLPIAAPAALRIVRDMPPGPGQRPWYDPPEGLERFSACSLSGMPATPACPSATMQWRISGVSRTGPCTVHVLRNGESLAILPPELENYTGNAQASFAPKGKVDIIVPSPGARYFITPMAPDQRISLKAEGTSGKVYWFVDQEFLGEQEKHGSLLWTVSPGTHTVSLVDEAGATAVARFEVVDILAGRPPTLQFSP